MRRLTVLLVLALACGSDNTGPSSIAGAYNLKTEAGQTLPSSTVSGSIKFETLAETLTMTDGGTFTLTYSSRLTALPSGTPITSSGSLTGTFTRNGGTLSFRFSGQATDIPATLSNGTITQQHPNRGVLVYANH